MAHIIENKLPIVISYAHCILKTTFLMDIRVMCDHMTGRLPDGYYFSIHGGGGLQE
jgi:hypothetical protein